MTQKRKQHHCPVCRKISKPRCFTAGHLIRCPVHNVYHSEYSECAQCKDQQWRDVKEEKKKAAGMKAETKTDEKSGESEA